MIYSRNRRKFLVAGACIALLSGCTLVEHYYLRAVHITDASELNGAIGSLKNIHEIEAIDEEVVSVYSYYTIVASLSEEDIRQITFSDLEKYTDVTRNLVIELASQHFKITNLPFLTKRELGTLYVDPALKQDILDDINSKSTEEERTKLARVFGRLFVEQRHTGPKRQQPV